MAQQLRRDTVFLALTRPQMFAGVTWSICIANAILAAELFLIFKSFWVILVGLILHFVSMILSLREPRIFDLWISRVRRCPRINNYGVWGCNSYRP